MKIALLAAAAMLPMTGTAQAPEPAGERSAQRPATPNALTPDRPGCIPITRQFAGGREVANGVRRLGELPPAQLALAVDRQVGGCREAVIIRQDIGGSPEGRR